MPYGWAAGPVFQHFLCASVERESRKLLPRSAFSSGRSVFGGSSLLLGRILAPHKPDAEKVSPYECGMVPFENARMKFDVRFYLIAILFILFDLETAFLFPWAAAMHELGWQAFVAAMVFLRRTDGRFLVHMEKRCAQLGVMCGH